jgi:hypothetical protein
LGALSYLVVHLVHALFEYVTVLSMSKTRGKARGDTGVHIAVRDLRCSNSIGIGATISIV